MAVPRMRGLKEAIAEIKKEDSETQFTLYALRLCVASGAIPCVRFGRRVLVDMDAVYDYLKSPHSNPPPERSSERMIPRIG